MRLQFATPCAFLKSTLCASYGFSNYPNPQDKTFKIFQKDVCAKVLHGSLNDVLNQIETETADAAIVLFGNCGGENAFVYNLYEKLHCPVAGGAAAIDPVSSERGLIFGREDVCVVLLKDDRCRFTAVTQNVHTVTEQYHALTVKKSRIIEKIDGEDAVSWYCAKRKQYGLSDSDFEHMTFSDRNGVNAHLSVVDGKLYSGRDLEQSMLLRYAPPESVYETMRAFYDDKDAIVFGCAGLKGILPQDLSVHACGLFLFGEVCTTENGAEFGNLMLSKLRIEER